MFEQGCGDASAVCAGGLVQVSSLAECWACTRQEGGLVWRSQAMVVGVPDSMVIVSHEEPG